MDSMGPKWWEQGDRELLGHTVWLKQEGPALRAVDECLSWAHPGTVRRLGRHGVDKGTVGARVWRWEHARQM